MSVHKNKTVHLGEKTNIYTVHVQRNTAPADLVGHLSCCDSHPQSAVVHWLKSTESDFALSLIVPV